MSPQPDFTAPLITIEDFENKVFAKEGIRIVLRGPKDTPIEDYNWTRKDHGKNSLSDWANRRLRPITDKIGLSFVAINGRGQEASGNTLMKNIRNSYAE
jgi:hypothetical protein